MVKSILAAITSILLALHLSVEAHGREVLKIAIANNFASYATQCADPLGQHFKNSISLALEEFNEANPNFEYIIELDIYDYGESDLKIMDIMDEVDRSKAIAIIGFPCSDQALMAAKLAEEKRIVLVSFEATSDNMWDFNKYTFKTCFKNSYQSSVLARYAYEVLGKKRMIIITSSDCEYCSNIGTLVENDFMKAGGTVVMKYDVLESNLDYDALMKELSTRSYDSIFVANTEFSSSKIIAYLVNNGIKKTFIAGDAMGNVEGMLFKLLEGVPFDLHAVSHWHYDTCDATSTRFVKRFREKYNIEPNDNSVLVYDGMMYLLNGIKLAKKKTREGLRTTLSNTTAYDGLRKIQFGPGNNNTRVSLYILKSVGNKFVLSEVVDP